MLYYSPQIWCSDNTDAINRLKIQYGTSFGYPISAMGSHVSVCPNHQSGRITPFETRGIVASAGTFGYELDLMKMSEDEKKIAREQILKYKEMEHLVQTGDYYRLVNPFENNNHVLWQFVSKDKKETVVCGVRLHSEANPHIYLFYPQGLDADIKYEDVVTGKVYTGAAMALAELCFDTLMEVAKAACAEGDTLHNMPFTVTPESVFAAIKAADAYGRYYLGEE